MNSSSKESVEKINHANVDSSYEVNNNNSNKVIADIAGLLSGDSNLVVDKAIEKQILAFSHREVLEGRHSYVKEESLAVDLQFAGTLNPKQWWRRLALPSFVAGGFVLTVFAFQALWQPLFKSVPSQYVADSGAQLADQQKTIQIQIEFIANDREQSQLISKPSTVSLTRMKKREQALAEFDENIKIPSSDLRVTDSKNSESLNESAQFVSKGFIEVIASTKNDTSIIETKHEQIGNQNLYTGSQLSKSEYPEQEIWVKRIVTLFKESQNIQANKELESFRKIYPNYSIDEKIKPYIQ